MGWARMDDRFHEHWKVAEAGLEAVGLWTMCLTWASQARRTSPTPGVVPESVLVRFAGGKAKRLAEKLHHVGLFDDKTDGGWPIHDYADYLPKYDADANRENGRRGGQARAKRTAKQTASKSLSEPPSESQANREANGKQTSSMRASVRRNPVPVPSEPIGSERQRSTDDQKPDDDPPDETAQDLVAWWIDRQTRRPPSTVVGHVAKHVGALLAENFTPDQIRAGLTELLRKGLNPSVLPSLVNDVANEDPDRQKIEAIKRHNAEFPWDPIALPDSAAAR